MKIQHTLFMSTVLMVTGSAVMAITPNQILADGQDSSVHKGGVTVRKGTIKALIENVKKLNLDLKKTTRQDIKTIAAIVNEVRRSIPEHNAIDVFEAFPVEDWLQDETRPGMLMVAVLYLQQFPEKMTPTIKTKIAKLTKAAHPLLKLEIANLS
jgi:hypothetical protein